MSILLLDSKATSPIKFLNLQLDLEREALVRAEKRLLSANGVLMETSAELRKAQALDDAEPSLESSRNVRIIGVRYDRHQQKVERCNNRVVEIEQNIKNLYEQIGLLQDGGSESKPAGETERAAVPSKKLPQTAAQQAKAQVQVGVANSSSRNSRASARPGDWPYLSNARAKDTDFALGRLSELKALSAKQLKKESPLDFVEVTAESSFGKATMAFIGENLFSTVQRVNAGRQVFEVLNLRQWHTIPEADNQKMYRIIFDISTISKPRLILFNDELLKD